MTGLPPADEQAWLLASLAQLMAHQGPRGLVEAPIHLPTHDAFPDPWDGTLEALRALCTRILGYAGLTGYRLELERFEGERVVDSVAATGEANYRHQGAAAWFAGVRGDTIHFGCADRQLEEAGEGLVGVMAHEVAHAWRTIHGLRVNDRDLEERLTDLSTIHLGFGIFTVNNTYRFRAHQSGLASGYSVSSAGYLSPEAMAFLFAVQLRLRGLGWWRRRSLLSWLEPRQRGFCKAALRHLPSQQELTARLLPEPPSVQI